MVAVEPMGVLDTAVVTNATVERSTAIALWRTDRSIQDPVTTFQILDRCTPFQCRCPTNPQARRSDRA